MPTLFVVATPIGNLEDITLRALRVLKEVDVIFCEDTRVTGKLLAHFGITKPLVSLRERAQDKAIEKAAALLSEGKNIAYTTDAGTPGISDPGGKLVSAVAGLPRIKRELLRGTPRDPASLDFTGSLGPASPAQRGEHSVTIVPIPGPSALAAAASIAGIPMDRFLFLGFPPHKKGRKKFFEEIAASKYPVIFYESPHRIVRSLRELQAQCHSREGGNPGPPAGGESGSLQSEKFWFGNTHHRSTSSNNNMYLIVCRELTKKFETVYRGTIDKVLPEVEKTPRGEFVVIVQKNDH